MHSKLVAAYGFSVALALIAGIARPVAFQKSNAIVPARGLEPLRGEGSLDVAARLAAIPYRSADPDGIYAVEPRARHRETVMHGRGNCSNLAFGFAYELNRLGLDYQVVHLLPASFLEGTGHTVLRTRYHFGRAERVGVVDMLEGGLPSSDGRPLDVADLTRGPVPGFAIVPLNERHDSRSRFYGAFLRETRVGYITAREMRTYFRFIEAVYVPLGDRRLEKYLYDGLAVVAGTYPEIRVPDSAALFAGRRAERAGYIAGCWVLRSSLLLGPAYLALALAHALARRGARAQEG